MISFKSSKSGELTALYNNKYIHSSYSPTREAKDFCAKNKLQNYSTILLIEPGLNYCSKFLKSENPAIKILSIYIHEEFYQHDTISDHKFLADSNNSNLKSFLSETLLEIDMESFKLIILPSASQFFFNSIGRIKEIVLQHLKELHGNITTTSGFGLRQIKNFIKNYMNTESVAIPSKTSSSILITASGPGLEKSINFIKENREFFLLIALPSSLKYLLYCGIKPDFVISTDPGYYASLHFSNKKFSSLIAPYTANVSNSGRYQTIIPLNQQSFIEKSILNSADTFIKTPANGTVAGSALLFSLNLTSGPIILCGLDFAFLDIRSHVRPHSFDAYIEKSSNRTNSITNSYFCRNIPHSRKIIDSEFLRINTALSAYRGWFASFSKYCSNRCFFLNSLTNPPGSFKDLNSLEAKELLNQKPEILLHQYENIDYYSRRSKINRFIISEKNKLGSFIKEFDKYAFISRDVLDMMTKSIIFSTALPEILKIKRLAFSADKEQFGTEVTKTLEKTLITLDELKNYAQ